jgi:hypothetical protein
VKSVSGVSVEQGILDQPSRVFAANSARIHEPGHGEVLVHVCVMMPHTPPEQAANPLLPPVRIDT